LYDKFYKIIKNTNCLFVFFCCYAICKIVRCAETERVPPATGVIVRAAAFPAGFLTVIIELTAVVVISAVPTVPVIVIKNFSLH